MPLFNVDDKKVKRIIKSSVGATEGDFNGQKMMCGTTVNPVVVINNFSNFKVYELNVYTANVEIYPFGQDYNNMVKVHQVTLFQTNTETNAKNFLVSFKNLDDEVFSQSISVANNTQNWIAFNPTTYGEQINGYTGEWNFAYRDSLVLKELVIKPTSAAGTDQAMVLKVMYSK